MRVRTFVAQQPVHVPDVYQVLLVLRMDAQRHFPLVHEFENLGHGRRRKGRGSLWEPAHEFVQKVFGADLEMERVATILD